MKFSIIIATHNAGKSLNNTLSSILSQTNTDYEVIVIDGVSTDGSQTILKSYESKFGKKLHWISEPDNGVYDAMNKGIEIATGEWLYFLGSGDYFIDNEVLASVSGEINKYDADVIYGDIQWGETDIISHGKFSRARLVTLNMNHQTIFCKKTVFDKVGMFETKYQIAADYIFNMKWFNDRSIRNRYFHRIITVYDTTGISSVSKDPVFEKERAEITKKYFPAYVILVSHVLVFFHRISVALKFLSRGDISGLKKRLKERFGDNK